ncbi:MAG: deoxyribonuclease IV [Methylacidiphilales bacterium]|nr:deoxyribonuclease IV [Candidatus Methylacidiphilales bacterium]MDW8348755.1 deoxyribonuclease IV [Verrucomicrobiae bacterium]
MSPIHKPKYPRLFGAHTSIAGGFGEAMSRIKRMGFRAAQIFVKNNHQWFNKSIPESDLRAFEQARLELKDLSLFGHTGYLINCASPQEELWQRSIASLVEEIQRAAVLQIPFLVLHPGSHGGKGIEWGIKRCAEALNEALSETCRTSVKIALETTAGQGHCLGASFEELASIYSIIKHKERILFCIDTAHIFAAGYDISNAKGYDRVMQELESILPRERIAAWHLNDSSAPLGSRKDRHQHLGKGYIGKEGFKALVHDERWLDLPMVLETPKGSEMDEDRENLKWLCSLI